MTPTRTKHIGCGRRPSEWKGKTTKWNGHQKISIAELTGTLDNVCRMRLFTISTRKVRQRRTTKWSQTSRTAIQLTVRPNSSPEGTLIPQTAGARSNISTASPRTDSGPPTCVVKKQHKLIPSEVQTDIVAVATALKRTYVLFATTGCEHEAPQDYKMIGRLCPIEQVHFGA